MRSLFVRLEILLLLCLTFGCSSINQITQDGIGQPISTIIDSWGTPPHVTPDGMEEVSILGSNGWILAMGQVI